MTADGADQEHPNLEVKDIIPLKRENSGQSVDGFLIVTAEGPDAQQK
jgi:hypothetical protein